MTRRRCRSNTAEMASVPLVRLVKVGGAAYLCNEQEHPEAAHQTDVDPREDIAQCVRLRGLVRVEEEARFAFALGLTVACSGKRDPHGGDGKGGNGDKKMQGCVAAIEDGAFLWRTMSRVSRHVRSSEAAKTRAPGRLQRSRAAVFLRQRNRLWQRSISPQRRWRHRRLDTAGGHGRQYDCGLLYVATDASWWTKDSLSGVAMESVPATTPSVSCSRSVRYMPV